MKLHIYERLNDTKDRSAAFHVPGHKGKLSRFDVTELDYTDNLECPSDIILRAQQDIAEILGAARSHFLTCGSSSGVKALVYMAARRGKKIAIPQNAHESAWEACEILGLEPHVLPCEIKEDVLMPPSPSALEKALREDGDICAYLAVSPDYYGNMAPLKEYSELLKARGKMLFCDEAHGAHLFSEEGYAGRYADAWVDGAHKSLPTLTQGSILSVSREDLDADAVRGAHLFSTTSPSYPVMASIEYGVKYAAENAAETEKLKKAVKEFRGRFRDRIYPSEDWTKIVADFKGAGISSFSAAEKMEEAGIWPEMADGRYTVFYLSCENTGEDLEKLAGALETVYEDPSIAGTYEGRKYPPAGSGKGYLEAVRAESEYVPLKDSEGRIAAENAGYAPPCIPLLFAGQEIEKEHIEALSRRCAFGVIEGKVKVVKR